MSTGDETKLTHLLMFSLKQMGLPYYVWKFHASEYDPVGIPDIVGMLDGIFLGLECKLTTGRFSPQQKEVLKQMQAAGGLVGAIMWDTDKDEYYYLSAAQVENYSLRSRATWTRLPRQRITLGSGPVPVLDLRYLKILRESMK